MPEKGSEVKFANVNWQINVPFVINADFEAIGEKLNTCNSRDDKLCTQAYQKHATVPYQGGPLGRLPRA